MNEKIQANLAIEIAKKSVAIATLEVEKQQLIEQLTDVLDVLGFDETLQELFNETKQRMEESTNDQNQRVEL